MGEVCLMNAKVISISCKGRDLRRALAESIDVIEGRAELRRRDRLPTDAQLEERHDELNEWFWRQDPLLPVA
jgi:hypothetical protein